MCRHARPVICSRFIGSNNQVTEAKIIFGDGIGYPIAAFAD
jgi:hypothetical protein